MASQFPSLSSPQRLNVATATASTAKKIPLRPGHSLMDWIRLTRSGKDMRGVGPGMLQITEEELAKHNKIDDAWMALRGFVYNVTKYMNFHPGGADELMRGVGKDATFLFNEIHNWVNFESMLKACLIGKLVDAPRKAVLNPTPNLLAPPMITPLKLKSNSHKNGQNLKLKSPPPKVSTEWFQTSSTITISCHVSVTLTEQDIVCNLENNGCSLKGCLFANDQVILLDIDFPQPVKPTVEVVLNQSKKTLDICLQKSGKSGEWKSLYYGEKHCKIEDRKSHKLKYRKCTLVEKTVVTHDTSVYRLQLPKTCHMKVPIGYHVYLQADIEDINISRPYTVVLPHLKSPPQFKAPSSDKKMDSTVSENHNDIFLMIKCYQMGSLTPHIDSLKIGEQILVSTYEGSFDANMFKSHEQIVLFCGGTGFTPMVRVIHHCLYNTSKCVKLYFYNKTIKDVLWEDELKELTLQMKDRFQVSHILSQPDQSWKGKTGRITFDHIKEAFQSSPKSTFACVCGPPLYMKLAVELLRQFGVTQNSFHVFSS